MRILIDADGVITNFTETFETIYVGCGGKIPEGFIWDHWHAMDKLEKGIVEQVWNDPYLFRVQEPYSGALEALERLNKEHEVFIVTSTPHMHAWSRSDWFRRNAPFIHRENQIVFTSQKYLIRGDVLVEDNLLNLEEWHRNNPRGWPVLIDRPWNWEETPSFGYEVYASLGSFAQGVC